MEGHQSFEQDDVSWVNISRLLQPLVLDEGVLRNRHRFISMLQGFENLVGQIEVQSERVIEIVLAYIDLSLINAYIGEGGYFYKSCPNLWSRP